MEDYKITIETLQCYISMLSDASLECSLLSVAYHSLELYAMHQVHVSIYIVLQIKFYPTSSVIICLVFDTLINMYIINVLL